jgi:hypothetical protein
MYAVDIYISNTNIHVNYIFIAVVHHFKEPTLLASSLRIELATVDLFLSNILVMTTTH